MEVLHFSKQRNQAIDADIDEYRQQNGKEESARQTPADENGCRNREEKASRFLNDPNLPVSMGRDELSLVQLFGVVFRDALWTFASDNSG